MTTTIVLTLHPPSVILGVALAGLVLSLIVIVIR
jgi:hypothetical protein